MASFSSRSRIRHELDEIKKTSDKKIDPESYFVLRVTPLDKVARETNEFVSAAKKFLSDVQSKALALYIFGVVCCFIFSAVTTPDGDHPFGGSHQEICSYVSSKFSIELGYPVKCFIYEFNHKPLIFTFFLNEIDDLARTKLLSLGASKKKAIEKIKEDLTLLEVMKNMDSKKWDEMPPKEKYGEFVKIKAEGKKNTTYATLTSQCEPGVDWEKVDEFIFS